MNNGWIFVINKLLYRYLRIEKMEKGVKEKENHVIDIAHSDVLM